MSKRVRPSEFDEEKNHFVLQLYNLTTAVTPVVYSNSNKTATWTVDWSKFAAPHETAKKYRVRVGYETVGTHTLSSQTEQAGLVMIRLEGARTNQYVNCFSNWISRPFSNYHYIRYMATGPSTYSNNWVSTINIDCDKGSIVWISNGVSSVVVEMPTLTTQTATGTKQSLNVSNFILSLEFTEL